MMGLYIKLWQWLDCLAAIFNQQAMVDICVEIFCVLIHRHVEMVFE